jgi:Deoxyxylulose-5-phosphate synthase
MGLLDSIESPEDVKKLRESELRVLAKEIRKKILETVTTNGGHLASNLGVVELTIALHRVFDSPKDAIIWDVGHQSYAHKLITGRAGDFDKIRKKGGLSGVPQALREHPRYFRYRDIHPPPCPRPSGCWSPGNDRAGTAGSWR